ncbi:MAG TPA: type IV secretory system conjugative DNA transfer family protein [Acidimicrobiales bacterium]|nr:type IV secretory system conjugative DNA transfer family protein [Acidimicrobiales bacterium]
MSPQGRAPGAPRAGAGRGERLALGVLATVAAVAALAWLGGQLAGLLASGRWPATPPTVGLRVLLRLPAHVRRPRQAWPAPFRSAVPGGPALAAGAAVAALGGLLAVAAGVRVAGAVRAWAGAARGGGPGYRWGDRVTGPPRTAARPVGLAAGGGRRRSSARWATARDLRALAVAGPEPGRVVLGRVGRRLVATEARHSVLVLGPTQSGKTTALAVPALLEWDGPVLATSVKGDLVAATAGWRSRLGTCWVFDPTAPGDPRPPGGGAGSAAGWSPLAEAIDWSGAQRMAAWLVEATPARHGLSDAEFWYAAAAKQLAPLLLAARLGGHTMADVVRWTDTGRWEEAEDVLDAAGAAEAAVALAACAARDDRIRSSVGTTLETVLAPFEDPLVARATARVDVSPEDLLAGRHSLYLCGPAHEQLRVQGVFAALVASVVAAAVRRSTDTGRPLDPPLLLVLDEVANIAPIRDLDGLASTASGLGIQLLTVCQDLAQLAGRYGPDRSRTIANNHRAKLVLSGVADLATLDLLSGLAGEQAVREESLTTDLRDGRRTRASTVAYRRLAPPDELRRIRPGEGVLVYGHLPAARLALRPWYQDRALRRRVGPASAG